MSRISAPAYGIGETPLGVLLGTRLTPTSRTRRWSPRKKKIQVGNCRWCGAPLWKSTKPPRDCGNTCAKAFSRHVNQLGLDFLNLKDKDSKIGNSGGLKAVWEALKVIEREIQKAIAEENHAWQKELRRAARGLLCHTPKSRRAFVRSGYDLELKNAPEDAIKHLHFHEPSNTEAKKRIGVITQPPEPTPLITGWERGDVRHGRRAGQRRTTYKERQRIAAELKDYLPRPRARTEVAS